VIPYVRFGRALKGDRAVYGIQAQGLYDSTPPHSDLTEMVAHYVREVRAVQPEGPYFLVGYSGGAILALEMAHVLRDQGQAVARLVLIENPWPVIEGEAEPSSDAERERDRAQASPQRAGGQSPDADQETGGADAPKRVSAEDHIRLMTSLVDVCDRLLAMPEGADPELHEEFVKLVTRAIPPLQITGGHQPYREARVVATQMLFLPKHQVRPYAGRVSVIITARTMQLLGLDGMPDRGRKLLVGNVRLHVVEGEHETCMDPPHHATLAALIGADLSESVVSSSQPE
jgi:thioesterase domain-containing protein